MQQTASRHTSGCETSHRPPCLGLPDRFAFSSIMAHLIFSSDGLIKERGRKQTIVGDQKGILAVHLLIGSDISERFRWMSKLHVSKDAVIRFRFFDAPKMLPYYLRQPCRVETRRTVGSSHAFSGSAVGSSGVLQPGAGLPSHDGAQEEEKAKLKPMWRGGQGFVTRKAVSDAVRCPSPLCKTPNARIRD